MFETCSVVRCMILRVILFSRVLEQIACLQQF